MAGLDLHPTSQETIDQLGISAHDLWLVLLDGAEYGPFETESLKHYASENQEQFEEAQASRSDNIEWKPFFSHPQFQRRHPQVMQQANKQDGPYWLLNNGQKIGPLTSSDIEKRIELGSIGFIDLASNDDGHTWHKLYQIPGFDRRFHSSSELPNAPLESDFQKARLELLEKVEEHSEMIKPSEELANMAHQAQLSGKVIAFRPEDVPLRPASDTSVSSNLKWQVPLAVAVVLTLVVGVRILATGSPENISEDQVAENSAGESQSSMTVLSHEDDPSRIPPPSNRANRRPANYNPNHHPAQGQMPNFTPPNYNAQIETHHNDYPPENDHYQEQPDENREPAGDSNIPGEPPMPQPEPQIIEGASNNPPQVEEVSDF